jgi:hypothetical protein
MGPAFRSRRFLGQAAALPLRTHDDDHCPLTLSLSLIILHRDVQPRDKVQYRAWRMLLNVSSFVTALACSLQIEPIDPGPYGRQSQRNSRTDLTLYSALGVVITARTVA